MAIDEPGGADLAVPESAAEAIVSRGRIRVESIPGAGSTFLFTLPAA